MGIYPVQYSQKYRDLGLAIDTLVGAHHNSWEPYVRSPHAGFPRGHGSGGDETEVREQDVRERQDRDRDADEEMGQQ